MPRGKRRSFIPDFKAQLILELLGGTASQAGNYRVLVKVIDIFGNDRSQPFDVEVR